MKATEARLLEFLRKSPQFIIPIYQRTYSWTDRECRQLWDDILRAGGRDDVTAHFVGSIVYIQQGLSQVSVQSPLLVIDGQQRLTSVSLLLEALARELGGSEPVEDFSAEKLRYFYLLNHFQKDERRFKLLLTQTDKQTLVALMQQKPWAEHPSVRVKENFEFFAAQVAGLKGDLSALCKGLAKLMIVDIALDRDHDNPQLIFESMNSTGKELSQADLIRNYVLMGLEPIHQTELYEDHWRPMEVKFGQEAYGAHFDSFMRYYLTVKTGELPKVGAVYEAFKAYSNRTTAGVDALLAEIHAFAGHYCAMALGQENDSALADAFRDLRELKMDMTYPFLLELYHDYAAGLLSHAELLKAVRLVEAYVIRRAACAMPTNSLNKLFATLGRSLRKDRYLESIQASLLLLPSYQRYPDDDEFTRELKQRDLYTRNRSYWLRRLENHGRRELVPVSEYTVEHIMPQNEHLSKAWQEELGPDWQRVHQTYLHTLGNLTLTGYNSEYSDRPFAEKRDMPGGFRHSPLRLNEGLKSVEHWDEVAILARAEKLATLATAVWPRPSLPADILDAYRPQPTMTNGYTIQDHPHIAAGPMRPLFDAFRHEVLALDPRVTEEFLKLYVAYKADTNFVDVVPQQKRLRLSLNVKFHEVYDPKELCKDVSNIGRWGNGDVEVGLSSLEELPYVISLVRQSLEKQLSNGEAGA
ncbi:MAG TPA: DUF262 domain-containing protein [Symbiobacteriaceae bacterium]|nr:DUF262 domain-containing protein [Symbiobacteriaceae bacterium]